MSVDRRTFLKTTGLMALAPAWPAQSSITGTGVFVNDIHSQLNPTRVLEIVAVDSTAYVAAGDQASCRRRPRGLYRRRPACHGRAAVRKRRGDARHDEAQSRPLLRSRERNRRGRSGHHVAGTDRLSAQGADRPASPVGHRTEADRRRQAHDRRSARRQCARPRAEDEAIHRRRRVVRADRRARRRSYLQPHGERGVVSAGHRRLRPVRCRLRQ